MAQAQDIMIAGPAGRLSVRSKGLERRPQDVVVLVQGANLSGQAGYDFQFPGGPDYSMMDIFVGHGLGVVTFSIRGYALSDAPPDPRTVSTEAAIEDLACVMDWVRSQGWAKPHLAGWSWGGRIAARYAEQHGTRIDRLGLLDPALGGGPPLPHDTDEPYFTGGWQYFHERLKNENIEPGVAQAMADFVARNEPRSPNGIRCENARGTIGARAAAIVPPTLMIYGSAAATQDYMQGGQPRLAFFDQLATRDKAFVIVPDCGDYAHFERPRRRFADAVANFLMADSGHAARELKPAASRST